MEFKISLLFGVCAIICTQYNFLTVNALLGPGVREAMEREFPFIVAFRRRDLVNPEFARDHICSATMISRVHVLSAAHCIENRLTNETVVLHGSHTLIYATEYNIQWWITFNEWSRYTNRPLRYAENDISVTKLTHQIADNFRTSGLSVFSHDELVQQYIELAAWGINNHRVLSPNLLTSNALVISSAACQYHIERISGQRIVIDERHFCTAGVPFTLLQHGDFGGPVLHFQRVIGVNKETLPHITHEFDNYKINVHTSINYYRSFITDVARNNFVWQ